MYQPTSSPMQVDLVSSMPEYGQGYKKENNVSHITSAIRWIQLKKYQAEVTLPLYMLTPRERKIFYLTMFVLITMSFTAALLYLPNHISIIYNRVLYYVEGSSVSTGIVDAVKTTKAALAQNTSPVAVQSTIQHIVDEV